MGIGRVPSPVLAFLLLAGLPAIGHADCLPTHVSAQGPYGLPSPIRAEERQAVEALVGIPVERVACGRIVPGMGISIDNAQIGAGVLGYLALTDKSLFFVRERAGILGRRKHDVFFQTSFDAVTGIVYFSSNNGPNFPFYLEVGNDSSLVEVAPGGKGSALFEALRTRVIEACGERAAVTASAVRCK